MNNNDTLKALSASFEQQCKSAEWMKASETLRSIARILHSEKSYKDELRFLVLSFYIDMSGFQQQAFVNEETVCAMRVLCELLGLDKVQLNNLYYETIKGLSFPYHNFTPTGCLRVLTYCIFGKSRKADKIISYLKK